MFRPARLTAILSLSCLMLTPVLPGFDGINSGAAYAEGKGGGNGGGNGGGGNGGGSKSEKAEKNGKSEKATKTSKATKTKKAATATAATKPAKAKPAKAAEKKKPASVEEPPTTDTAALHPSELGKMNGALNASPNAILAHIRNGQTTNGPVGLMAGLAVADAAAAESLADVRALEDLANTHDALTNGLTAAGYASLDEYLAAKAAGTALPETQATIDGLITSAGGLTADGTGLATTAPTDEELALAHSAAATDAAGVTAAEDAFVAAWNKDGDSDQLLDLARERLATFADDIAETISATKAEETTHEATVPVPVPEAG